MKQKLFKISTELKRKARILALLKSNFEGYRYFVGNGAWHGKGEATILIEVLADTADTKTRDDVFRVAQAIRELNNQEAVGIEETEIELTEIRAPRVPSFLARNILARTRATWQNRIGGEAKSVKAIPYATK